MHLTVTQIKSHSDLSQQYLALTEFNLKLRNECTIMVKRQIQQQTRTEHKRKIENIYKTLEIGLNRKVRDWNRSNNN